MSEQSLAAELLKAILWIFHIHFKNQLEGPAKGGPPDCDMFWGATTDETLHGLLVDRYSTIVDKKDTCMKVVSQIDKCRYCMSATCQKHLATIIRSS